MTLDRANGSVLTDDESSPPPIPSQSSGLKTLFGFGSLPGTTLEEATESGSDSRPDPAPGSVTGSPSEQPLDEQLHDEPSSGPTSSPGRASSGADGLLSKGQLRDTFRAGVHVSTSTAHRLAARTEGQRVVGLYLADDDDARAIADPLASIAYRRGGLAGGKLSPDTNDFLQSVMGIAGYLAKQIHNVTVARQIDAQHGGAPVEPGEVA